MDIWEFENDAQKAAMEEIITAENCGAKLKLVREISGISRKELANSLGCSESTLMRIETQKSEPTGQFMNRLRGLTIIGHHKYKKLTDAERETMNETLKVASGVGGVATGIGGSISLVSASGSVAGLFCCGNYFRLGSNWRRFSFGRRGSCGCDSSSSWVRWLRTGERHPVNLRS